MSDRTANIVRIQPVIEANTFRKAFHTLICRR